MLWCKQVGEPFVPNVTAMADMIAGHVMVEVSNIVPIVLQRITLRITQPLVPPVTAVALRNVQIVEVAVESTVVAVANVAFSYIGMN